MEISTRRGELPRVTYTNLDEDFSGVQDLFDQHLEKMRGKLGEEIPNRIDGREHTGDRPYSIPCPFDNELTIARCFEADQNDVDAALSAARKAFEDWSRLPWKSRVEVLRRVNKRLDSAVYDLAAASLFEVGKSRFEALGEAEEALDFIPLYTEEMEVNQGYHRKLISAVPGELADSRLRPVGVFGVVGPFNFSVAIPINMISAALLTGNTVVYKPSRMAGLTASLIVSCFEDEGLPRGALNLLCGGDETGAALVEKVDGVAFTGSSTTGRHIHREMSSGSWVRPVIAEMGGKNPTYLTATADLDAAAEGLLRSAFGLQGQKCSACEVAYIDDTIYEEFVPLLIEKTREIKVGCPDDRDVFMGPLINEEAVARYESAAAEAREHGRILFGGSRLADAPLDRGFFVDPMISEALPPGHPDVKVEHFLPYLTLQRVTTLAEGMSLGNDVDFGLCAGFYGREKSEFEYFKSNAEAGVLYSNRRSGATTGAWPGVQTFGGWKNSGVSGKNAFGAHYLPQFMREQSHTIMDVRYK